MYYALIDSYEPTGSISVFGEYYPSVCLVRDLDGIPILLTSTTDIHPKHWSRALDGCAAAVMVLGKDPQYALIESGEIQRYRPASGPMAYTEMLSVITPISPFVHLHAHSDASALDGLSTVSEMVDAALADNQPALAVTDHGVCTAHPELQLQATKAGIKPIFGVEAYFVPDRHARGPEKPFIPDEPKVGRRTKGIPTPEWNEYRQKVMTEHEHWDARRLAIIEGHKEAKKAARSYYHLILWAMNDEGLRNLWAMSTASYMEGFYGKPRMDWEVLTKYGEGVMCSTACLSGPLAKPINNGDEELARSNLGRLLDIFGDRLYVELHTNLQDEQIRVNRELVKIAHDHSVPMIAVVDSHYPCADDAALHKVWLGSQTNKDLKDDGGEESYFKDNQYVHFQTHDEVVSSLDYLPGSVVDEAVGNTTVVADRCTATLKARNTSPTYSKRPTLAESRQRDMERAMDICTQNWSKIDGKKHPREVYIERFEKEAKLLTTKGFWGYYLMVYDQVAHAKNNGILVGPGRGSGGGSLIAYLMNITEIDPVEADLLFERFLTEGRSEPPDFDVDYPTSKRDFMQDYCSERWGADHVMRVGTTLRLQNKATFQNLSRVFKNEVTYTDFANISQIITRAESGTAGFGLSWDELWAQVGPELEPYREKYPKIFAMAERMKGRIKSYGRHAAGLVISPEEVLSDVLPMRVGEKSNQPISQFDMEALMLLGYNKFDILTLRTLDTLQMCLDLIAERKGQVIDVYRWRQEYEDPQVWDELCEGNTKGVFQIETAAGTRLTKRFRPHSIADLADIAALVRPGPERSGLTKQYLLRREGKQSVEYLDPRLETVLAQTQGVIVYQEQVMQTCQILGGYSLEEADGIRKILGKKQVDKIEAAGKEFIPRVCDLGMERAKAELLWAQLGEFAKYSFGKAHAWSYAVLGHWTAWFKYHYPIEFFASVLSTVDKERIPEFINEARRMGYSIDPPDINESGIGFRPTALNCRYGFDGIDGLGESAARAVIAGQPYTSFPDFMARKGRVNMGAVKRLAMVGAFDSFVENRKALVAELEELPPPTDTYTDDDVRRIEKELLGIHLSSTPFDRIPKYYDDRLKKGHEVLNGPPGPYQVAAIVTRIKPHVDRNGRKMAFLSLDARTETLDVTVFQNEYRQFGADIALDVLGYCDLVKNDRGIVLNTFYPA